MFVTILLKYTECDITDSNTHYTRQAMLRSILSKEITYRSFHIQYKSLISYQISEVLPPPTNRLFFFLDIEPC